MKYGGNIREGLKAAGVILVLFGLIGAASISVSLRDKLLLLGMGLIGGFIYLYLWATEQPRVEKYPWLQWVVVVGGALGALYLLLLAQTQL